MEFLAIYDCKILKLNQVSTNANFVITKNTKLFKLVNYQSFTLIVGIIKMYIFMDAPDTTYLIYFSTIKISNIAPFLINGAL